MMYLQIGCIIVKLKEISLKLGIVYQWHIKVWGGGGYCLGYCIQVARGGEV